jgi:hypothetical protein
MLSKLSLTTCSCSAASAACEWVKATDGNAKSCDRCISIKKKCFFAGPSNLTAANQGEETMLMSLQMLKNEIKLGFDRASKENVAIIEMVQDLLAELKHARADRNECARVSVQSETNSEWLSAQAEGQHARE